MAVPDLEAPQDRPSEAAPSTIRGDEFAASSYQRHAAHFDDYAEGGPLDARMHSWKRSDTVDAWRHARMYRLLDPLILIHPHATWATVGDGRLASDATYLTNRGLDVVATDISETLLVAAREAGYITRYQVENAERLSFEDGSFDFILCKEAYHHFPRPAMAIYEMLRVARVGVVLIEPADRTTARNLSDIAFLTALHSWRWLRRRPSAEHQFEETGNYIYTLSRREIEKMALALNYRHVAFGGVNDRYVEGAHESTTDMSDPLFRSVRRNVRIRDLLTRLRLVQPGILVAVIFKIPPESQLRQALKKAGFEVVDLPKNPYA